MPHMARANGLWDGPELPEFKCLTYAETKIIQLARLYVSVKRVYLDSRSYAKTANGEVPRHHEKNVVAYPENLDIVNKVPGTLP